MEFLDQITLRHLLYTGALLVVLFPIAFYILLWSARLYVKAMRHYYSWKWHFAEIDRIRKAGNTMSILNPKWTGMPNSQTYLDAMK